MSQFGVVLSRFTFACERLRGPRLPASFLLFPVLSVWVNAALSASSARYTPRLPVAAILPLLGCVYVTLVSNSLPRHGGLRYRHDTASGRQVAVRRVAQAIWPWMGVVSVAVWLGSCCWPSCALDCAALSLLLLSPVPTVWLDMVLRSRCGCSAVSLSSCWCDTLAMNPSFPWSQGLLRGRMSCLALLSHHSARRLCSGIC